MSAVRGLTEREARERRERGEGNEVDFHAGRSYADIVRANVLNPFNAILLAIGGLLIALGRINDALISIGPLFLANAGIRTAQETYAKRKLDQIAIASRPTVTVVREGKEVALDPALIVKGDLLRARAGDPIMADGVVGEGRMELDESLLTGESDLVPKRAGDAVLSGSICVAGAGYYRAEKVGAESLANRLTIAAREYESERSPLQRNIDAIVRIVVITVSLISLVILAGALVEGLPFVRLVQISAVLTAQVPYGLFFIVIVANALGAVAVSRRGAVVQTPSAIESLSSIDVLCMDKTGTLTANRLRCVGLYPVNDASRPEFLALLGRFAVSASSANRTSEAIAAVVPGAREPPVDEIPFASSRGWSALVFGDETNEPTLYVLGSMEALAPHLAAIGRAELAARVRDQARQGLRVLVFARGSTSALRDDAGRPQLPALEPMGMVALADELRPDARETVAEFARLGIQIKIISGDDPDTVATLARRAGIDGGAERVSGVDLERMSAPELAETAAKAGVFGRIAPQQKAQLIEALIRRGHRVAMIGDGVNDVLGLKKAQLGIAMQSGSGAARNVADMVLLDDTFAALRPAFVEGKRIIAGVTDAMCLYLTRVSVATLVIVAVSVLGLGFPFEPAHVALTYLTAGIPSFFLVLWARPDVRGAGLRRLLLRFVIPAAALTGLIGVALYAAFYMRVLTGIGTYEIPAGVFARFSEFTGLTYGVDRNFGPAAATIVAQTVLSVFMTVSAFVLALFLAPPLRLFTGWADVSPDKRPAFLALGLFAILLAALAAPALAHYFALFPLRPGALGAIALSVLFWALALRFIWRKRLFDRFIAPH